MTRISAVSSSTSIRYRLGLSLSVFILVEPNISIIFHDFQLSVGKFQITSRKRGCLRICFRYLLGARDGFCPGGTTRKLSGTQWSRNVKYWVEGKLCRQKPSNFCQLCGSHTESCERPGEELTNWNDGKGALSAIVEKERGSGLKDHGFGTDQDWFRDSLFLSLPLSLSLSCTRQPKAWQSLSLCFSWLRCPDSLFLFTPYSRFLFLSLPARQQWLWRCAVTSQSDFWQTRTDAPSFLFLLFYRGTHGPFFETSACGWERVRE